MKICLKFLFTLTIFFHFSGLSMKSEADRKVFKEAEGLFAEVENVNDAKEKGKKIHSVINKLLQIKSIKDNQDNSYEPINKEYASLLFKSAGRLLQLDHVGQPLCMLCLKKSGAECDMANSHYISKSILDIISSYWAIPRNNTLFSSEKMTLRLLCKGKKNSKKPGCEELLSQKGENNFCDHFLPFMDQIIKSKEKNIYEERTFFYGPWLFHTIASLAYRVFLSDLENHENWLTKISNNSYYPEYIRADDSLWAFFFNLRQFILQPDIEPNFCIKLYLSGNGMMGNNELPLNHNIGSASNNILAWKSANDNYFRKKPIWHHWVLFSIRGFHFLVLSSASVRADLEPYFTLLDEDFTCNIYPTQRAITIEENAVFSLPEIVKGGLKAYQDNLIQQFGAFNGEIVSENIAKIKEQKKVNIKDLDVDLDQILIPQTCVVRLPDGLTFIQGILNNSKKNIFNQLFSHTIPDSHNAVWFFENTVRKYYFVIVQFQTTVGLAVVGWKLNVKEALKQLSLLNEETTDFSSITKLLEVLPDTDHSNIDFSDDPGIIIAIFLVEYQKFLSLQK